MKKAVGTFGETEGEGIEKVGSFSERGEFPILKQQGQGQTLSSICTHHGYYFTLPRFSELFSLFVPHQQPPSRRSCSFLRLSFHSFLFFSPLSPFVTSNTSYDRKRQVEPIESRQRWRVWPVSPVHREPLSIYRFLFTASGMANLRGRWHDKATWYRYTH